MPYRIVTLPQAEADATEYALYIARDSNAAASRWLAGLEQAFDSLTEMPSRCTVIPEEGRFRQTYRHLHYHSHRLVFFIDDALNKVVVARIYHGARNRLEEDDLPA